MKRGETRRATWWLWATGAAMLMLAAILSLLVPYLYSELRGKRHD